MDGTRDALWLVGQSRGHGSRSRSAHGLAQALTCQLGEIRGACYSRLDHGSFGQLRTRGKVRSVLRWANKRHYRNAVIVDSQLDSALYIHPPIFEMTVAVQINANAV